MNTELLITILKFATSNGRFERDDLDNYLKQNEYPILSGSEPEVSAILNSLFTHEESYYRIKPQGYIILYLHNQVENTSQIVKTVQKQTEAAIIQAEAAQKLANASEIEAKKANKLALWALFIILLSTCLTIYFSLVQIDLAKKSNENDRKEIQSDKGKVKLE